MGELIIILWVLGAAVAIFLFVLPIWFMLKSIKLQKKLLESVERIERKIFRMDRERYAQSSLPLVSETEKTDDGKENKEVKNQQNENDGDVELYV